MEPKSVRAAFIPAIAGTRVRIILLYGNQGHFLYWFKLGKDGSIYFGPSYSPTTSQAVADSPDSGTSFTIGKDDLQPVTDPAQVKDSHVSVHTSGAINLGGRRFYREHLRGLFEQERIASFIFEHPSSYPLPSRQGKNTADILLNYPIDETRPLLGELLLAPMGKERYVTSPSAQFQVNIVVQFAGCSDGLARSCQFALYHTNQSDWPQSTYVVMPSGRRAFIHRLRRWLARLTTH